MGISLLEARRREIVANQPHLDTMTGDHLTLERAAGGPLKSCLLTFGPVQEGTGDPSPSNVRPISGRTGVTVYVSGADTTNPTSFPDTWPSAGTVYGGTLDLLSGTLTATWGALDLGSLTYAVEGDGNGNLFSSNSTRGVIKPAAWSTQTLEALCSIYTPQTGSATYKGTQDGSIGTDGNGKLYIYDSTKHGMTASEFKASLSGVMLIYALRTPVVHQVDPATIHVPTGHNIIWSSADEISATCYTY